ncbi:DUF433 domain-containing protein [Jatrophihabitans sp. DSM 45814]
MTVDRFGTPLYSVAEASRYLGVSDSTFRSWAKGYKRRSSDRNEVQGDAIVTTIAGQAKGDPVIPFVGLAEGLVLAGIRRSGVPLQRVRPALDRLKDEFGLDYVLASKRLYTDGAEVLYDFGQDSEDSAAVMRLVVVRNGQHVFTDIVQQYLKRIDFASDGYAEAIRLPSYESAEVVVTPKRGFGQPTFERGGARLEDVLGAFWAGESLRTVAHEYGIPEAQLEDALRVASRAAA